MEKRIVYQIDSFTKEKFKGNPAGVVTNAEGMTEKQMQQISRELNNSETAFLFPSNDSTCDGVIRYFTPKMEVPICGHATIAAMTAKAHEENLNSCILKMKTNIGVLPFEIIREKEDYKIVMTQGKIEIENAFESASKEKLLQGLGLAESDLDERCPVQIASTGHSKVMIGIKSKEKLDNLAPNFYELSIISKKIKCNGYFVFTFNSDNPQILTCGRMFAPAVGINEDPVTGNANGPLGAYLIHNKLVKHNNSSFQFKGMQGAAMGRPGIVDVKVKIENHAPAQVQIAGEAVVVFKTEIIL